MTDEITFCQIRKSSLVRIKTDLITRTRIVNVNRNPGKNGKVLNVSGNLRKVVKLCKYRF